MEGSWDSAVTLGTPSTVEPALGFLLEARPCYSGCSWLLPRTAKGLWVPPPWASLAHLQMGVYWLVPTVPPALANPEHVTP